MFGAAPEWLRLENPIAADLDQMRPTPLASLALAAGRNAARGFPDVSLFEIGPAFLESAPDEQCLVAAGIRTGATDAELDRALPAGGRARCQGGCARPARRPRRAGRSHHPDRAGSWVLSPGPVGAHRQGPKLPLGRFGELHPRVIAALDLPRPAVAFEIFLDCRADAQAPGAARAARSLAVPAGLPRFRLRRGRRSAGRGGARAARGAERGLIAAVTLFDVFAGPAIGAGKKSLAIEVVFQPRERTLTDAEIEAACRNVVAAVAKATGGVLRG